MNGEMVIFLFILLRIVLPFSILLSFGTLIERKWKYF